MTLNNLIVHSLTTSQALLQRFVADLSPQEYLHRAAPTGNCTAWVIGHLILSERNALQAAGVTDMPALPEGFEKKFPRDESAATCSDFGDISQLMPMFNQHRERLIAAVRSMTPEQLSQPREKPHPLFATTGEFLNFMAMHVTMHAGQITMIRRTLGRPPLV